MAIFLVRHFNPHQVEPTEYTVVANRMAVTGDW